MIDGVPAPVVITDPDDPRVADFRDLKAGDRPEGTPRWTGPVIVEGVPAVERLLASPYRVRAVFGVPGRVAALDLPDDVAGVRGRQVGAVGGDRLPAHPRRARVGRPPSAGRPRRRCWPARTRRPRAGWPCSRRSTTRENLGSIARSALALGIDGLLLDPRCADPFYRRSVRVSMGHILALPFAVLPDWPGDLDRLHDAGYTDRRAHPGRRRRRPRRRSTRAAHPRTAVLLGAEGPGLTPEAQQAARVRARIPMRAGRGLPRRRRGGRDRLRHPPLTASWP